MFTTNSDSVHLLLSELCKCFQREFNPHETSNITSARKLKSLCYEILLKKSPNCPVSTEQCEDPLRDLDVLLFEKRISSKNDHVKETNCKNFEKFLKYFSEEPYFQQDEGRNILTFLLALQGSVGEYVGCRDEELHKPSLLVPGPFTLHASHARNPYYPNGSFQISKPTTENFAKLQPLQDSRNPYLPRFLFRDGSNKLTAIDQKYGVPVQKRVTICSGFVRDTWGSALNLNPFACKFFTNVSSVTTCFSIQPAREKKTHENIPLKGTSQKAIEFMGEEKTFSWNWEHLGTPNVPIAPLFSSEFKSSLYLNQLLTEDSTETFSAKVMELDNFIADVTALVIGIQSDIFQHDEFIIFHMLPDVTVSGVSPAAIESFVSDFLECGTCYKRLQIMITKKNYKLMFDGFIFKALCSAVEEYLVTFRNFVISFQFKTLSDLRCKLRDMMKQIVALAHTLAIHPSVDSTVKPPIGSQFLGYLYREITQVTQRDIVLLLVYILKRCCYVYFKHLQKWIYYGLLDDPCNELFICFVDHYRSYTKYFFDKAYFVRRESVPGFFQGFEDQILQCGKYAMLLKAFKPNHPLFDIEYPSISVCLSFEEVQAVQENCKKYAERARETCGKPITTQDVFNKRLEKKKEFFRMVSEKSKKNMEKWAADQEANAALRAAEKKKRLEEIQAQLQEARERKLAERQANIQLELKLLKENEDLENKRLLQENFETQKRIEYYQELTAIMEERKQRLEMDNTKTASAVDGLPTTPASSNTDFESCCGEEDTESRYEDCVSTEFLEKFKQSEDDLMNFVTIEKSEKDEVYNLENATVDPAENNDNINVKKISKSASDFFNSNEVDSNVLSELEQNRNKVLSSNINHCFSEAQAKVDMSKPLTEAQKIKLKVLVQEFGYQISDTTTGTADINSNPIPREVEKSQSIPELSELQKNRQKMMQNDTFAAINREHDKNTLHLDLNSERWRNRRKVLESEFHILTGESNSLDATPMSTTSDTCSFDDRVEDKAETNKSIPKLKVDIDVAKNLDVEKMQLDVPTAVVEETPECALNTAGIMAKNGFDFFEKSCKTGNKSTTDTVDLPINLNMETNNTTFDELSNTFSYPYKRCEELLKSNFRCKPLSPFFSMNLPQLESSKKSAKVLQEKLRQLNSLSAITLTEFLQKSVTIPLCTHLEIMNNETMRIFLDDLDIIGHFKSLRNYFFLMDGEFGSFICDGLIARLEKGATPNELFNYQMLHSILDSALGSSIRGNDKNAENLSFTVTDFPEKFDLNSPSVLDNLSLSYRVAWPVNLILNPETLEQYANIFKYLMKVRRISWLLEEAYQRLKEIVKKHGKEMLLSPQYRRVQQIRQKLFHFVHALRNHITSSALQASWKTFKDDLISAKTTEELYRKHTIYIKRILFLCMLNKRSAEFYNTIENIFKVSLKFHRNLKSREWKKLPGNEHFTHSKYEKLLSGEEEFDKLIKFTIYLGNKIVRHGYQEEIGEFISLINYNYYYVVDA